MLQRLDKASPRELNRTLRQLQQQLNGIQRGTKAWDAHIAKIQAVKAEIQRVNATMATQKSLWSRMNSWLNNCQTAILGIGAAITGLVMAGRKAVSAYAEMEEQMANTRKYTGMAAEDVDKLNEAFRRMDTRTPRERLNELAQEAGRLGKNTIESVQGYVEAADIINVALVDLGEGATQTIAKLTNIFGVEKLMGTKEAMLAVGSTVNVLSQNCTASKPYLVEFAQRMAGIGSQAGLTIPQILAFGAVLDANGQKVEMSATAIQKVIMNLANENHEFAATLGLDAQKLNETLKHSAKDGLLMFLEALQKMGQSVGFENATMTLAPAFKDMGLDAARVSQVLSTLAMHLDEVKWQMREADKAFKEASSATHEYEIFNNTVQASIDKARARVHELAVELGEKLYPMMKYIYTSSSLFLRLLNTMVSFITKYKTELVTLTASIAAYVVVIKAQLIWSKLVSAALAIEAGWYKVLAVAQGIARASLLLLVAGYNALVKNSTRATAATHLFNASIKANPLGLLLTALTAAIGLFVSYRNKVNEAARAVKEAAEQRMKTRNEFRKQISDITEASSEYAMRESANLKMLYNAATDETKAMKERIKAVETLQKQYPDYFGQLSQEAILVGKASQQYEDLTNNIIKAAKARAAQDKIVENEKLRLDIEIELDQVQEQIEEAAERRNKLQTRYNTLLNTHSYENVRKASGMRGELDKAKETVTELIDKEHELVQQLFDIDELSEQFAKKYGTSVEEARKTIEEQAAKNSGAGGGAY
ncbi:MAG: phage tail tape measure protein, partial [Muribaculaceae bacterium]|nr:phage tail tape measure protein [Muribaculaceae bacterium]